MAGLSRFVCAGRGVAGLSRCVFAGRGVAGLSRCVCAGRGLSRGVDAILVDTLLSKARHNRVPEVPCPQASL